MPSLAEARFVRLFAPEGHGLRGHSAISSIDGHAAPPLAGWTKISRERMRCAIILALSTQVMAVEQADHFDHGENLQSTAGG